MTVKNTTPCDCLEWVNDSFRRFFYSLGVCIGERPGYFIIVPVLLSLLLGTGLQQSERLNDPETLFAPVNGQAQMERRIMESLFPVNFTAFNPSRFAKIGRLARLIVTAKDGGSLLREEVWTEIQGLDTFLKNVSIKYEEGTFSFESICAQWGNTCYPNDILELGDQMSEIESGNVSLSYPIMLNPLNFKTYTFSLTFGGMTVSNESTVTEAKALVLNYFVNNDSPKRDERGGLWESAVIEALENADTEGKWKFIKIARFFGRSVAEELDKNTLSIVPYMLLTVPIMIAFAVVSCMTSDWVRSKPWLGGAGVIAANLGTLAAFGLLCYCGVPIVNITIAAPFLLLGIGMDDMFVMLAAWRRTSVHDPVPKRMGEAYAEAAVSITITSLTDCLSFLVGIASPFLAVQIFCTYTAAAVVFTYLLHILFFGGAMALSGYHEAENRHSVFLWLKSTPRSKQDRKTTNPLVRLLFTGGHDPLDPLNSLDHPEHRLMNFFRDIWTSFLMRPTVKFFVLILFGVYIGVSCWGITLTKEGMELSKLARDDSYANVFYSTNDKYFKKFPYRVQVVVTGDLLYSDKIVQIRIEELMSQLENTKHTLGGSTYTESWLRSFLRLAEGSKAAGYDLKIENEENFIENLDHYYLGPSSIYSLDVKFNENKTRILASRFIIQTVNVFTTVDRTRMVNDLRAIAGAQSPHLNVTIFHPFFNFFDQYLVIRSTTIQCVFIAGIVMMAISLIFIPNPLCSLWVAFSVVSIEAGVLGFLALWQVNLDAVSMTNLIMCIGFSVDFSAHISYAYMSAKAETPEERLKGAFYALGLPIVQGGVSTVLGVSTLFIAPSYVLTTFFKSVLLVMVIAAVHGLLLLPVLLSLFGPGSCTGGKGRKHRDVVQLADMRKFNGRKKKDVDGVKGP